MAMIGVHHVAFTVRDEQRSRAFYEDVLGFRLVGTTGGDHPAVLLKRDDAPVVLSLREHVGNDGRAFSELTTGLDHLAFAVERAEELDEWQRRFEAAGVTHSPVAPGRRPGMQILVVRDPDDIQLELVHVAGP